MRENERENVSQRNDRFTRKWFTISPMRGWGEPRGRKSITNDATKLNTRRSGSDCELAQVSASIDRHLHLVLYTTRCCSAQLLYRGTRVIFSRRHPSQSAELLPSAPSRRRVHFTIEIRFFADPTKSDPLSSRNSVVRSTVITVNFLSV